MVPSTKKRFSRLKLEANKTTFLVGALCFLSLSLLTLLLILSWAYWGVLLENQELKSSVLDLTNTKILNLKKISYLEDLLSNKNAQKSSSLLRAGIIPVISFTFKSILTYFCGSASAPYLPLVDSGLSIVSNFFFPPGGFKTTVLNNISLLRSTGFEVLGSASFSPAQDALEILTLTF